VTVVLAVPHFDRPEDPGGVVDFDVTVLEASGIICRTPLVAAVNISREIVWWLERDGPLVAAVKPP